MKKVRKPAIPAFPERLKQARITMNSKHRDLEAFSRWLRALRAKFDMTATELAGVLGVSVPLVSHLEQGYVDASVATIRKIAEVLNGDLYEGLIAFGKFDPKWHEVVFDGGRWSMAFLDRAIEEGWGPREWEAAYRAVARPVGKR